MTTKKFATRPYVNRFLKDISRHWEVVIFTAGTKEYADLILNELDKENYITRRLYRDSCLQIEGVFVKDLKALD